MKKKFKQKNSVEYRLKQLMDFLFKDIWIYNFIDLGILFIYLMLVSIGFVLIQSKAISGIFEYCVIAALVFYFLTASIKYYFRLKGFLSIVGTFYMFGVLWNLIYKNGLIIKFSLNLMGFLIPVYCFYLIYPLFKNLKKKKKK